MQFTVSNMMDRVTLVMVVVVMVAMVVEGQRQRPSDKAKEKKDLFWFKVAENSTSSCENVDESTLTETVVEGPPAETCQVSFFTTFSPSCHVHLQHFPTLSYLNGFWNAFTIGNHISVLMKCSNLQTLKLKFE